MALVELAAVLVLAGLLFDEVERRGGIGLDGADLVDGDTQHEPS